MAKKRKSQVKGPRGTVRYAVSKQDVRPRVVNVSEVRTRAFGGSIASAFQGPAVPYHVPKDRKEHLERGYKLWKEDAIGGAIVSLTTFFTFGRGIRIKATNRQSDVLQKFWTKNDLGTGSKAMSDEAVAYGENFVKMVVHKADVPNPANPDRPLWRRGQVQLVPIPSENVVGIEHDPLNIGNVERYFLEYSDLPKEDPKAKVVREDWPPIDKFDPESDAACMFHLKFNAASNDVFGTSELVRVEEWIKNYAEFLRDGVVINKLYRSPCYDITIKDGDAGDVRAAQRRYNNWQIGANPCHNDKEEWSILEFAGANVSQETSRRALLLVIAAGVTMPEFFFADAANGNFASSKTQLLPAVRKFEDRQETYKSFWQRIFSFVLDVASTIGTVDGLETGTDFEGEPVWDVEIHFPPVQLEKDLDIAQSNVIGLDAKYMSPQSAAARAGLDYEQEFALRRQAQIDERRFEIEVEEGIAEVEEELGAGPREEPVEEPPAGDPEADPEKESEEESGGEDPPAPPEEEAA